MFIKEHVTLDASKLSLPIFLLVQDNKMHTITLLLSLSMSRDVTYFTLSAYCLARSATQVNQNVELKIITKSTVIKILICEKCVQLDV